MDYLNFHDACVACGLGTAMVDGVCVSCAAIANMVPMTELSSCPCWSDPAYVTKDAYCGACVSAMASAA